MSNVSNTPQTGGPAQQNMPIPQALAVAAQKVDAGELQLAEGILHNLNAGERQILFSIVNE